MSTATQNQPTSSTAMVVPDNVKQMRALLHQANTMSELADAIGPNSRWVKPEYMVRVAMTVVMGDEKLQACDPRTVVASVIRLGQVGLVPDGFLGQAYLIPRRNGERSKKEQRPVIEATPLIGYRGYGELAVRSGRANSLDAQVVYDGDQFDYEMGSNPLLRHRITLDTDRRGKILAAYAIVYMKEGPVRFQIMPLADIMKAKKASESSNSDYSPWKNWEEEMIRKTPVRKLAKYVPLSPEFQMAGNIDEFADNGTARFDPATGAYVLPSNTIPEERSKIEQPRPYEVKGEEPRVVGENGNKGSSGATAEDAKEAGGATKPGTSASAAESSDPTQPTGGELFPPRKDEQRPSQTTAVPAEGEVVYATDGQVKKLMAVCRSSGIEMKKDSHDDELHKTLKEKFDIDSIKKIPKARFDDVLQAFSKGKLGSVK